MRPFLHWNENEFASLFEAIYPSLTRYLDGMLGPSGAAQDVAQEALVRLFREGAGRIGPGEERFWVYRVATNLARNELRRARIRRRLAEAAAAVSLRRAETPHETVVRTDDRARLLAALSLLPESQRAAFLLREQQGLRYAEIAVVLGVSLAKVKVDIHRARCALRESLCEPEARSTPGNGRQRHGM